MWISLFLLLLASSGHAAFLEGNDLDGNWNGYLGHSLDLTQSAASTFAAKSCSWTTGATNEWKANLAVYATESSGNIAAAISSKSSLSVEFNFTPSTGTTEVIYYHTSGGGEFYAVLLGTPKHLAFTGDGVHTANSANLTDGVCYQASIVLTGSTVNT